MTYMYTYTVLCTNQNLNVKIKTSRQETQLCLSSDTLSFILTSFPLPFLFSTHLRDS